MKTILSLRFCTSVGLLAAVFVLGPVTLRGASDSNVGIAIHQTGVLAYPPTLIYSGVTAGEARAVISVDATGRLIDCLVVAYTDPEFAATAVAALRRWTYEPAQVGGVARASRAEVGFIFRDNGVIVQTLPGAMERKMLQGFLQDRLVYEACLLRDLDRIPTPVHVVAPVATESRPGLHTVTVEFYIDEEGKVRVPAVARESANDVQAAAAVAAVEQWRFEPPLRKGRPVLVFARQEFNFRGTP